MVGQNTNIVVVSTSNGEFICGNRIPHIDPCFALIVLIMNCIWPGLGTAVTGCIGPGANCCAFILLGLAQFLLIPFLLIGWIWSICTGIQIVRVSSTPGINVEAFIQR